MRIAGIIRDSLVNGPGIRDVIFVQGCSHHCKGCHNKQTWDYGGGQHAFVGNIVKELSNSTNDVTISGGEPLDQYRSVIDLCKLLRKEGKRIWLFTGNTVRVPFQNIYLILAKYVDVIVDGTYIEALKDENLLFRGSSNQRLIDLPKSIKENRIVEWEG